MIVEQKQAKNLFLKKICGAMLVIIVLMIFSSGCSSQKQTPPDSMPQTQNETFYKHDSWKTMIPEKCKSYFDGCNNCQRTENNEWVTCTEKHCTQYQKPTCLDVENTPASQEQLSTIVNGRRVLTSSGIEKAEKALSAGARITDKTGDWIPTGNPEDNPSPYPIDFIDIKEVVIGIDDQFLYSKVVINGKWPSNDSEWPIFDGDETTMLSAATISFDADNNPKTGCQADGGIEMWIGIGDRKNDPTAPFWGFTEGASGKDDPEEERYLYGYSVEQIGMAGGRGYDYAIVAVPIEYTKLQAGQEVTVLIKSEAMSKKYHHASFDDINFLRETKVPGIKIKLGENNNGDIVNNTFKQINDAFPNVSEKKSRFDVYPETSSAPVLHMYWDEEKTAKIPLEEVNFIGRFGVWENLMGNSIFKPGFETATEIEIHTTNKNQPMYAFTSGTITQLKIDGERAEISVRYGTDYALKYSVVNYNKNLTENSRVESGDFLGYAGWFEASNQPPYGFFEFEFNKKINGNARAIPPIDYFDAESKASLEKLPAKFGFSGWVVDPNDKKAGWVAYVGQPVAWATGMPFDMLSDDPKEYYAQYGMGFIFK